MSPFDGRLIVGPPGSLSITVALWDLESSDSSFGLNFSGIFPNSFTGDVTGIDLRCDRVMVSTDYVSGSELSGSATRNSQSFNSQNITPGTYTTTYNGEADSVVLQVGATPELGSAPLFGCAGLHIVAYRCPRKSGGRF
jgi:hypothetical protein